MISIKKLRASLAVFMIAALVLTPFSSNAAVTKQIPTDKTESISMNESVQVSPELKISSDVKNALTSQRYVGVLVKMNEQVDTTKVARETEATLSAKTPYQKKMASRYAVVDKLQETAEKTQTNLINLLEAEKKNGNVQEYQSFYIINMIYVKATEDVVKKISMSSEVKEINLNKKIQVEWPKIETASVNNSTVQSTEWNIDKVGAPAVWTGFGVNGSGVVVGSIDTGFDYTHEALKTKWRGYNPSNPSAPNPVGNWFDAVSGRSLPYDEPTIPHGTHVLGTILGQDPSGQNIIGVAPGAQFINVKAFTPDGGQDNWLLAAGEWMLSPGGDPSKAPDIINNSWGGSSGLDEWYRPMVQAWRDAGILPVFSAGNQPGGADAPPASVSTPANYPESFAVASVDRNEKRANDSRRGPSPYPAPDDLKPDISAPGVNVRSSVPGGYQSGWSGTSMAAPHVSGTAALLLSYNAALSPDQLEQIMTRTATPLTDSDYPTSPNNGYGYGLVNAFNAVSSVATGIGTIQGKVLKPGIDSEDAVIVHNPITMAFSGMEPTVTAEISDNISVTDVELYVKSNLSPYWAVIPMTRTSGDFKNGVYSVDIPYMFVEEPGFQYKIRAYDYGSNRTETPIYDVTVKFGIKPGEYSTDFSAYPDGWLMDGDWQWGETTTGVAPLGNKLVATILNGNYSISKTSWLITPPIDLRNSNTAILNFRHWYETENSYDKLYILTTNDLGLNWTQKAIFTGTNQKKWENYSLDLSSYKKSSAPVFVGFVLVSDISIVKDGWYIDDVALTTAAPTAGKIVGLEIEKPEVQIGKDGKVLEMKNFKFHKDPSEYNYYYDKNEVNAQPGLPLDATVTILETGRTVRTSLADGSYKITHAASEAGKNWTLLVESYGFYPTQEQVQLNNEQVLTKNFIMQEMPKGSVSGRVVNERNNEPIAGAVVKVVEDFHVQPVTTDANGYYSIPGIYVGQYTLKVAAQNYKPGQASVNVAAGVNSEINVQLKPFIGSEDELGYDDGSVENARAFYDAGNGWAVRMTPNGLCQVKGAKAFFYNNTWPVPGGNRAAVAIYDSLPNGDPGNEIFKTEPLTIVRGQWNDIDLSSYGFSTDKDFYMAIVQVDPNPNCPGMGMDESSSVGRSYAIVDGGFQPLAESYGNIMLRAKVAYELASPIITSPVNGAFTNSDNIAVTGKVGTDSLVKVYVNGQVAGEAQSADKAFTINVPLAEGENIIKATSTVASGETDPSAAVTVIRDITNPVLEVTGPVEGFITNERAVDVTGNAIDTYLDKVTVNGNVVSVAENGSYRTEVIVHEGANTITVVATDKAGNSTTVVRTVNVGLTMPTITDIMPNADMTVRSGEPVTVSFHSNAIHGTAFFRILVPIENNGPQATGIRMNEVSDGYYVGTWTVPANLNIVNAVVQVEVTNTAGNKSIAEANGKITVIMDKIPPVLIPDTEGNAIGQNVTITFENNTEWITAITNVLVNGQPAVGSYTVEPGRIIINGSLFSTPGDYQIVVVANGYRDAAVTQTIQNVALLTPPTLRPTSINNYLGKSVTLTFTDDPAWRAAITGVTLNGQSIAGKYYIYRGQIIINANAFPAAGTYTIAVKANGYEDAVVTQVIRPR